MIRLLDSAGKAADEAARARRMAVIGPRRRFTARARVRRTDRGRLFSAVAEAWSPNSSPHLGSAKAVPDKDSDTTRSDDPDQPNIPALDPAPALPTLST